MCPSTSRRTERRDDRAAWTGLVAAGLAGALNGTPAHAVIADAVAPLAAASTPDGRVEALLLAVRVNGIEQEDTVRALRIGNGVALNADDWKALHLRATEAAPLQRDGLPYLRLDAVPGLRWRVDEPSQTLLIDAPSSAFVGLRIGLDAAATPAAAVVSWGGYTNYDLQWQRSATPFAGGRRQSGQALLEAGAFGPPGSARVTALVHDIGVATHAVRLDSTWTQDRPERMASLRIGDAIGHAGAWGRALRFGGVQYATDFSTQPGFLSFPLPAMRGEAALPSTVDVYVNNSRRLQGQVPAGPFELTDVPLVTGSGQVRVVVRDLLGREQVIVQPYYVSPALLRPGLHAFSYEIGAVREDYGIASGRYGKLLAAATDRLGISANFTRELRAEAFDRQVTLGATGLWLLPSLGIANLSAVGSHAPSGDGALVVAAAERHGENWNGSVELRRSTAGFTQLGQAGGTLARTQGTLAIGGTAGGVSMGLSYVQQTPWDGERQRLLSINLAHGVCKAGTLGLFALRDLMARTTTLALSFSIALDGRSSAALTSTGGSAGVAHSDTLQVQRSVPDGTGFGYQIGIERGDSQRGTAQALLQTEQADFQAGIAHASAGSELRAGVSGALAWLDDSLFAGRRIAGSFAVVEVGDYPDVQVLHDNRPVARTDSHGRALVGGLRGYEINRIGVDAADLPFDAEVNALEVELVPPARSGVVQRIPVQRRRAASFRIVDAAGLPLPAGSLLHVTGRAQTFPIGFDGRSFASGLAARTRIHARGPAGDCSALLELGGETDDLPDLGTVSCR